MSKKINTGTKIEFIKVSDLKVDPEYQRDIDQKRANAMAERLDTSRIGTVVVARRHGGDVVIIDGQHRCDALVTAGFGEYLVRCEVHDGLTQKEEAELFLKLNNGRSAVRAIDQYKAALKAEQADAVEIDAIVRRLGLRVQTGNSKRSINAVKSLVSVHKRQGNLERVLWVLTKWMDGESAAYHGDLIKAVGVFLAHYGDVDLGRLMTQLKVHSPEDIVAKMKRYKNEGGSPHEAACMVLAEQYNKRLSARNQLPPYRAIAA